MFVLRIIGRFWAVKSLLWLLLATALSANANEPVPFTINNDGISEPLAGLVGDAASGRTIVANRQVGLCILCHQAPIPEERLQGDLATNLAGAGSRWSAAQLRLRIVDARKLNPKTIMPSYYRTRDLNRVGTQWRAKPVLTAQQIEDVVAYLATLKESKP
jgi:sulfur-oxidizing protein SoxX